MAIDINILDTVNDINVVDDVVYCVILSRWHAFAEAVDSITLIYDMMYINPEPY